MTNNVHPIFARILDTFSGQRDEAMVVDLQAELDDARADFVRINREGCLLRSKVADLIEAFAEQNPCDPNHLASKLDVIDTALLSLIEDARGPAWRRTQRICSEMERTEDTI